MYWQTEGNVGGPDGIANPKIYSYTAREVDFL